ncbi:MAG TPA: hypothetical protein VIV64_11910 [Gammaproteobacteria bacterium]
MSAEKHVVVLVHGMGKHPPGDFRRRFIGAVNAAMRRYRGFEDKKIENLVVIEEASYDAIFDEARERMARRSLSVYDRLARIDALTGRGPGLVLKLANIERRLDRDEYLYTHLLDVVLYSTLLGARARIEVGRRLARIMADYPTRKIHVVAYSLGTAVVHDTLDLLYRENAGFSDGVPGLDVDRHRLASVWMIANVSRLMASVTGLTEPYASLVRPAPGGCTDSLFNVRHKLDVFTWFRRFEPANDESWIPREHYERAYVSIETSAVRQANTHDFANYIESPEVSVPLLRRLVRLSPDQAETDRVAGEYRKSEIPGAFDELLEALSEIRVTERATLTEVAIAVREYRQIVEHFRVQLDAVAS